ncbi:hypothetical protein E4U42_003757 [Claviceps africana]|uniref:Uncharacterized protein n=1 Tax=Claviceps africana TaxID=83212 RepID=A0A8K0J6W8_9HYPO|nr:hypothetical protein E4U42_003757 [Claviceps africana]
MPIGLRTDLSIASPAQTDEKTEDGNKGNKSEQEQPSFPLELDSSSDSVPGLDACHISRLRPPQRASHIDNVLRTPNHEADIVQNAK